MYCYKCGTKLDDTRSSCPKCGNRIPDPSDSIQLKCSACGGTVYVEENNFRPVKLCPYCGSKEVLIESDNVIIERIKSNREKEKNQIYREVEFGRQQLEREKIYSKVETRKRLAEQQWIELKKTWKIVLVLVIALIGIIFAADVKHLVLGEIHLPAGSTSSIGQNYEVVVQQFIDAGFSNIETNEVNSYDIQSIESEIDSYDVVKMTINGDPNFPAYAKPDELIRVFYYVPE